MKRYAYSHEFRGISVSELESFLLGMGQMAETNMIVGAGWEVTLIRKNDVRLGALLITAVHIEIVADDISVYQNLISKIRLKFLSAGG